MKRRKPIACLISACRRKTCRTRAGRIARRGGGGAVAAPMRRRGRRPIEAPGSAAPNRSGDGAPRLPAPPSRVTLLVGDLFGAAAERLREPRHVLPVLDHELPVSERPGALRRELRERGVHLGWSDLELLGEPLDVEDGGRFPAR